MAQRKQSGKHFGKYRWHSNDRQLPPYVNPCHVPGPYSSHHRYDATYYQGSCSYSYNARSHDQMRARHYPAQLSRGLQSHNFNYQDNRQQERKRSLVVGRFHEQSSDIIVDVNLGNKRVHTEVSNCHSSQMDKELNDKEINQRGYSHRPPPSQSVGMGPIEQQSIECSGVGNKRGYDCLHEYKDFQISVQSKKFKAEYQEASTSHQRDSSISSRNNSDLPNCRVKRTAVVETLPYPAEGVEVLYTKNADDAEAWLQSNIINTSATEVGLDIEWRPQFVPKKKGGKENRTAVIQLAAKNTCLVLHIFYLKKYPKSLSEVLSNRQVLKVGSGINGDVVKLLKDTGLLCDGRVDTQDYARCLGIQQGLGLKTLAKQVLDIEMDKPKSVSLSNWEFFPLRKQQIHYAALDAWISLKLYLKLKDRLHLENKRRADPMRVEVHYGEPSQGNKKKTSKITQIIKGLLVKTSEKPREKPQLKEVSHSGTSSNSSGVDLNKMFKCPIMECCGNYENKQELQDHIKTRHVACKVCGKLYRTKVSVKHKRQHAKDIK